MKLNIYTISINQLKKYNQGIPYGMSGTSAMMGMGGLGLGGPMSGFYSGSNMAASLLAQSKCRILSIVSHLRAYIFFFLLFSANVFVDVFIQLHCRTFIQNSKLYF